MASLGSRCGNALLFLNAEEQETRLGRTTSFLHQLKPKLPKLIGRACLTANLPYASRAGNKMRSSPQIYVDPIFVNLETCFNRCERQHQTHDKKNNKISEEAISPEKLDEWMRDSVSEIVRNIGEAPFLVHVYSKKGIVGSSPATTTRLEREKAIVESWPRIRRRWEEGWPTPDGVILVEQLKDEEEEEEEQKANSSNQPHSTRAWGLLIQGRGVDCAACYILKTCRVWSSLGFCTHFCLVKAKCFGETAELQLKDSWLQM